MKSDNLLLVTGSGRNSGKTTIVCKIIEQFSHLGIVAVKISPHFHSPSGGLIHLSGKPGFNIFEETDRNSLKDTSRMLQSGARKVYFIQSGEEYLNEAFSIVYKSIASGNPVICESPALINYIKPELFIIMISPSDSNLKNIENQRRLPHLEYTYEEIIKTTKLPIDFAEGAWKSLK